MYKQNIFNFNSGRWVKVVSLFIIGEKLEIFIILKTEATKKKMVISFYIQIFYHNLSDQQYQVQKQ